MGEDSLQGYRGRLKVALGAILEAKDVNVSAVGRKTDMNYTSENFD